MFTLAYLFCIFIGYNTVIWLAALSDHSVFGTRRALRSFSCQSLAIHLSSAYITPSNGAVDAFAASDIFPTAHAQNAFHGSADNYGSPQKAIIEINGVRVSHIVESMRMSEPYWSNEIIVPKSPNTEASLVEPRLVVFLVVLFLFYAKAPITQKSLVEPGLIVFMVVIFLFYAPILNLFYT